MNNNQNHNQKNNHSEHDHSNHHEMMARDFKVKFFIALILSIPVLALSPSIQQWFGFSIPSFAGENYLLFGLASIIALYTGWPFYSHAKMELKKGEWGMMTLVSLAVLSGYLYSGATTFFIDAPGFYWEISTLVLVLLLGHWLEMRAVIGTTGALKELAKLIPPKANKVLEDGSIKEVDTGDLQKGDIVLIKSGEKVPIDGEVIDGSSSVNESMITGESKPVEKIKGDEVVGGTINGSGSLRVKVTKTGKDTALSQIMKLVKETQSSKPKTQRLADRAAHWLTIIAITAGALTFITWNFIFAQSFIFALTLTITVIVITCPHALGLAIPTVTTISTTKAAQNGILVKNMDGLERAETVDYVVFDKTGTLTEGQFGVSEAKSFSDWTEDKIIQFSASLDRNSDHVIAKGVVREAENRDLEFKDVKKYKNITGKGSKGIINGDQVAVGNFALMKDLDAANLEVVQEKVSDVLGDGETVIYLFYKDKIVGIISLSDVIRDESYTVIKSLHSKGIKVAMLTGDTHNVASSVAEKLGVDTFFAGVKPDEKIEKIKELQGEGYKVMMVGDGINDGPALIQADVGVAIGAGTDVAIESAEIVLVKNNPLDVVKLMELGRRTSNKMRQNLWWAAGYNIFAIPLAAGVLYDWGILLRPEWGALLMTASSIIVVINALLLKGVDLEPKVAKLN